jgi:hypothetical protein
LKLTSAAAGAESGKKRCSRRLTKPLMNFFFRSFRECLLKTQSGIKIVHCGHQGGLFAKTVFLYWGDRMKITLTKRSVDGF